MKLAKAMREAFMDAVEASLPPVPRFDFEAWKERYRALMEVNVPEELKAIQKKYPGAVMVTSESFHLSDPVRRKSGRKADWECQYVYLRAAPIRFGMTHNSPEVIAFQKEAREAFAEILAAEEERYALLRRLEEVVKACTTDAALRELLPEMAHLIPKPPEKTFPVATIQANNLVAELVKAGMELKEAA